ncbi:hypothetical protein Peur_034309 [Populus x canadensis]
MFPFFNKIFGFATYVPSLNALSIASKAFSGKALSLPSDCDLRAHGAAQATIHCIDLMLCSLPRLEQTWIELPAQQVRFSNSQIPLQQHRTLPLWWLEQRKVQNNPHWQGKDKNKRLGQSVSSTIDFLTPAQSVGPLGSMVVALLEEEIKTDTIYLLVTAVHGDSFCYSITQQPNARSHVALSLAFAMVLEIRLARTLAFLAFMGTSDRIVAYVTCMDGWYMT